MRKLLRRLTKVFTHSQMVRPFLGDWIQSWPYHLGDGSRSFRPRELFLYVNNVCNASCLMCDIGTKKQDSVFSRQLAPAGDQLLPFETWERLIFDVAPFRPKILVNGVEPLFYENILDLAALIKRSGLHLQIVTNGILLEKYAADLTRIEVDSVVVSLDGPEEVHDRIRGEGVFRKALAGIDALHAEGAQFGGKRVRVSANFCISDLNCRCLVDFAEEMLGQGRVDFINFTHLNFVTSEMSAIHNRMFGNLGKGTPVSVSGVDPGRVDVDVLCDQISQLRRRFSDRQVGYNTPLFEKEKLRQFYHHPEVVVGKPRCLTPWNSATIAANGDVVIRSRCFSYVAGNLTERPFLEIWRGDRYRRFRRELRRVGLFPVCTRCCGSL